MESISISFSEFVNKNGPDDETKFLNLGQPSFDVIEPISREVYKNLKHNKYSDPKGLYVLRNEIKGKLNIKNKIECSEEENIIITNGASHAIYLSLKTLLGKGDECIIIEPYWKQYELNVNRLGAKAVFVKMDFKNQFSLNIEKVINSITDKTKVIILNFPNNPTGEILSKLQIKELINFINDKNIYIISDEVYEDYVYSDSDKISISSFSQNFEKIISIFSFSKTYSMTGYRVGYIVSSKEIINKLKNELVVNLTCISHAYQIGALHALKYDYIYRERIKKIYENIVFLKKESKALPIYKNIIFPKSGFYLLLNTSESGYDSITLAKYIFNKLNIALCPGLAFGPDTDKFLRISVVEDKKDLIETFKILSNLKELCN